MKNKFRICWFGLVLGAAFSLPTGAALVDRGNGLIQDTVLNIFWLQDASLGGSGRWGDVTARVDSLEFGGLENWRLPSVDANGDGLRVICGDTISEMACRDNELGYMYYYNLTPAGDIPPTNPKTNLTGDQDPIQKIQPHYWGTAGGTRWLFRFDNSVQAGPIKGVNTQSAMWAVHPIPVLADALINVTPTTNLITTELGDQATFEVVLNIMPSADVTIDLLSSDDTEGMVEPFLLTFTPANWDIPQVVTVTGEDDSVIDGPQEYEIIITAAVSDDLIFDGKDPEDISITNLDDEVDDEEADPNVDIDGNGEADALTDGILVIRYLFDFRGKLLCDGAVAPDATRYDPNCEEIEAYLDALMP